MMSKTGNRLIELDLANGLRVRASDDPASPLLLPFFEGYSKAFVLPNEMEDLDGFRSCMALNATHRNAYGRTHSELVAVFENAAGERLGGANFLATAIDRGPSLPPAAVALNYVYVEEAARGRGMLRVMLAAVRRLAMTAIGADPSGPAPAIFIEQNDPLRLSPEEFAADTAHSGTDQIDRLAIWDRVGARIVDWPYVQPALSGEQKPDDGLVYAAVEYPGGAVAPAFLHDHLESFFGISVLKGMADRDGVATRQLAALAMRTEPVALMAMGPALAALRSGVEHERFDSLRELAAKAT